jgi:hypothetical protein
MSIKTQNKELAINKKQFGLLLEELESLCNESVRLLGHSVEDNFAQNWVWDYLNGETSLKDLRAKLKGWDKGTEKIRPVPIWKLEWNEIDGGWEAVSVAAFEPYSHMNWRVIEKQKKGKTVFLDDSPPELQTEKVKKARFKSLEDAFVQYQIWENEMIKEMGAVPYSEFEKQK